ncbi:hypothetical protein BpOF4_04525 [Alkalihalophilus pseudofirmus OF4]|uniref:Uncharacterized protein n=1 Tax=Alkalihalophilus pseudofirmus (strain ATCC BAA-2126 / JCM 17055 / OF4) TaxID=398511 RepID=D3FYT6_ALKPO|nr:hypothetical protein [Alkalihalophilus pseudofirmus]ADC48969.1 hypothetical protein BpOF4_04525 [Alkalihalophilus pseudofirmus OF4]
MYRPTVRYADVYKDYVDALFKATTLDRNQIIRAALFNAAHSNLFSELIRPYLRKDVPLPRADWSASDHGLWLSQGQSEERGGGDVNGEQKIRRTEEATRRQQPEQGRIRQVRENGGIKITIG